ncbi:hypothetical protein [Pseudomonas protegens]|uniref:hypothetical protein n=1 Tax=Pseudomonas protegens TaxID=380021 RepID=UPI00200DFA14|nr:hypothetical protein [Pseudomonas protegens]
MSMQETDFLLLNCCNLPWRPIYPYAFVQISEIARRFDIRVTRIDLLYVEHWYEYLKNVIKTQRPKMIGIHLRQGDSLDLSNYDAVDGEPGNYFRTYYPVEDSRRLIRLVRELTDAPIIMGGFGFTTHARKLANYLEIDLGLQGCPDGFFRSFNDTLSGRNLGAVPGLIHKNGAEYLYNDVGFYKPAEVTEYRLDIVNEIKAFYGPALQSKTPPTIAVEVSRGCPFQCYFCVEPDVKGKRIDKRNLDVVEADLEFLLKNDLYDFWFICSELNIGGAGFALELAERVIRLNERYKKRQIKWSGYSLPSLGHDELKTMMRAGYTGAMNDILSLDEDNLKRAKVPYKREQAVTFLKSLSSIRAEIHEERTRKLEEQAKFTASAPIEYSNLISFFLGNAHADRYTIARTLAFLEESGLTNKYEAGYVIPSTRVFGIGRTQGFVARDTTYSFGRDGVIATDSKWPTFHFPEFLVSALGDRERIYSFFNYVSNTLMCQAHRKDKSFSQFIALYLEQHLDDCSAYWTDLAKLLGRDAQARLLPSDIKALLSREAADDRALQEDVYHAWLLELFGRNSSSIQPVISFFGKQHFSGVKPVSSDYVFTQLFYARFSNAGEWIELAEHLAPDSKGYAALFVRYIEYAIGLVFRHEYKDLLFEL